MDYKSLYYLIPRNPSGILYYRFKHSGKRGSTRCRSRDEAHEFMRALIEGTDAQPVPSLLGEFAEDFFDEEKCAWLKRQKKKGKRFGLSCATEPGKLSVDDEGTQKPPKTFRAPVKRVAIP